MNEHALLQKHCIERDLCLFDGSAGIPENLIFSEAV